MSTTFWIQFLGTLFGIAMLYFTFIKFKRKELSKIEAIGWFLGWVIFIIIAIVPFMLDPIVDTLRFYRRLDFFVVVGFFVLLGLGFYTYNLARNNQRKFEKIVRRLAIKKNNKETQ
ncbi:MAG: DUF2304 domain-containing protein [Nanoarchaeota archaeon]|nr:DUF2304 domain-containing protein [Nanoarchaeota archaeon]